MSDLLLLKDKQVCPKCRAKSNRHHTGACANCGIVLFLSSINFKSYESDGNRRNYWLWNSQLGWVHRDHVMNGLKANERFEIGETPSDDYGKQTTPDAVSRNGGKISHKLQYTGQLR